MMIETAYFNAMKTMMNDIYIGMEKLKEEIKRSKKLMGFSEGLNLPKKITLPADIADSLQKILDYLWPDEQANFEGQVEFAIFDDHKWEDIIRYCEENNLTDHIFYHILKVKQYFNL